MELWIRSQDKECLIKIDRLDIDYTNGTYKIEEGGYKTLLAEYGTKKRALEVLDEIQNLLKPKIFIKDEQKEIYGTDGNIYKLNIKGFENTDIQSLSTYVYEMPEK